MNEREEMEGTEIIYYTSKEFLINIGIKDEGIYPGAAPFLFWTLFIIWILYLILGNDQEIKAKLKRIVLFAYFLPMIPFFLYLYLMPEEERTRFDMSDIPDSWDNHFFQVVFAIIPAAVWPLAPIFF